MRRNVPITARIALFATVVSLAGNAAMLGFIHFATFNEHEALAEALQRSLWLALLVSLVFGIGSGWLIARFVGRRVDEVGSVADAVGAGDLTRRATVGRGNDAFVHLASRLNAMLDRIQSLMSELRVLTDSLAHDLRSPVQRLRARVERALTADDDAQRDQLLSGVLAEADNLIRVLATVMEIGRLEAHTPRNQFAPLDPAVLLSELAEMYEPLAEEKGVKLTVEAEAVPLIDGHRQLLAQALSNLVDNALHYADGNAVVLFVACNGEKVRIGVADRGQGIAASDRADARRRFGRLDASRGTPGAGLGLSLVDAVAHLHGGKLALTDNTPGLRATMELPQ